MNAIVKDVMTAPVVAVRTGATFTDMTGVVAVRDRFSYPGMSPSALPSNRQGDGPVICTRS